MALPKSFGASLRHARHVPFDLTVMVAVLSRFFGDLFRYGEDHVVIGDIQEFGLPILDPLCPRQAFAFGTMSIPATIEGVAFMAALVTSLQVTAEDSGAAHLDGGHDAALPNRHRRAMLLSIGFSVAAEHVRHFQLRTVHGPALRNTEVRRVRVQRVLDEGEGRADWRSSTPYW